VAITDYITGHERGANGPYEHAAAVTPHDDNDLPFRTTALWVGGTGDLAFTTMHGEDVTLVAVPAGTLLRVRADKVLDTGTDATLIVALG
jgi:hypothetical protein